MVESMKAGQESGCRESLRSTKGDQLVPPD